MIFLDEEFKEKRGLGLVSLIQQDIMDNWPRYQKVMEHRALYDGSAVADMPVPWAGASRINIPLMMEKSQSLDPLVMSAIWGIDPVINVQRSPDEYFEEQTDDVEQFINFVVNKDIPGFYETTEMWFHNMGLDGMSFVKPYWEKSYRRISELHILKFMYDNGDTDALGEDIDGPREKTGMELLVDIFGAPNELHGIIDAYQVIRDEIELIEEESDLVIEPTGTDVIGQQWNVDYLENRERRFANVEFISADHVDEVRARVSRDIVDQDCVNVDVIEYEDLILPYRTKNIKSADRVTHKFWLTVDEIEEKYNSGEFDLDDKDMGIIKGKATKTSIVDETDPGLQEQKDSLTGQSSAYGTDKIIDMPEGFKAYNSNKVMCFEVYMKDDIGNGVRQEVIYTIIYPLRKIVRAEFLDEIFPHGRRPFIKASYYPVSNRNYAIGLGDQLAAINLEVNAIINLVNNNQELIINPWFMYEPGTFIASADGISGIKPGEGIPVVSTKGILFPNFQVSPLADMQMMSSLLMFADRMTISPLSSGSTQMKNAPRTARGTLAVMGEGHVKTDMLIKRLQKTSWMELIEQIFGLYKENGPDEKWYWITRGEEKFRSRMTKEQLRGRYEFNFKGNTVNTNREALAIKAQVRYNTLMSNPDFATDPKARINLVKDFLHHWGDGTDVDRLTPSLPGEGAYAHPPMRQQDENKVIELGGVIQPLPSDQHAEHLTVMDAFEKNNSFAMMPEHAVGIWASHKMNHMEMLRQQSQQSTMPVSGGQANNVPLGESGGSGQPGKEGLNVMEGGVQ